MEDLPTPESRVEAYLAKAAGMDVTPPEPKSRLELYLAKIAGMDVEVPEPTTREEHWLAQIVGIESSEPLAIEGAVYIDNQKVDVRYLATAAGITGASLPEEPQNRKEQYWEVIAGNGPTPPTPPEPKVKALKFTSAEAQGLSRHPDSAQSWLSFEYSNDGETWATWDVTTTLDFGNGVDLYLRGMNSSFAPNDRRWQFQFTTSTPVYCSGNLMHLLDYTQDLTTLPEGGAQFMFAYCPLVTAPDLPATILPEYAYYYMFQGCTSLLEAPALPATTVGTAAYSFMFSDCSALTKANRISALTLPEHACEYMFHGCTSLVTAPALPALSLGPNACSHMFQSCTNLETIPALPATTLGTSCYQYMFASCSKIKMATTQSDAYPNEFIFGTNPAGYCNRMFRNTGGTYVGNPDQTTYYTANTIIS